MLQKLIPANFRLHTFLQNSVQCCVWYACWGACLIDLHGLNKHCPDFIHLSFNDGLSPGSFCFTDATSLITQFVPFENNIFGGGSVLRHHMKYPLHCNYRSRVMKLQHMFSFFCLRHKYKCSASGGKI